MKSVEEFISDVVGEKDFATVIRAREAEWACTEAEWALRLNEARRAATSLGQKLSEATALIEKQIREIIARNELIKYRDDEIATLMNPDNGKAMFAATFMADAFGTLMDTSPQAENYFEYTFQHDGAPLTVRVQRHQGKSPATLVAEANKERDALAVEVARLKELLEKRS